MIAALELYFRSAVVSSSTTAIVALMRPTGPTNVGGYINTAVASMVPPPYLVPPYPPFSRGTLPESIPSEAALEVLLGVSPMVEIKGPSFLASR